MRILITGGAGCLGSNLIEHWLPMGHEIFVIDNFATGKRELVPAGVKGLGLREGSVADEKLVRDCFEQFGPEIVVHAAASYKDPNDWAEDANSNVLGSANVAKAAKDFGVKRLVNFQTSLCYGRPEKLPVPVDHKLAPFTSYGISKTAGEQFMMLSGVPTLSLRIASVIGPRFAIGALPTFYKRLKEGKGCFCSDSSRDFLDMSDFLAFMDMAIKHDAPTGVFNLSDGKAHTIKELYEVVAKHLGKDPSGVPIQPVGDDDVAVMVLDPSATEKAFGWKAMSSFEETMLKQLQWYDAYGVSDVYSHLKPAKAA